MVRNHRGRSSRGTISCVTNNCQLRGRSPKVRCLTRLGAHNNLDLARRVCVYFRVCITTAVIKRVFMNNRQADQACTEPRGTHDRGNMSVGGAIARGTEHPYVRVAGASVSTPLNSRPGWWVISVRGGRLRDERGVARSQCRSSVSYLCVGLNWRRSGASVG